MTDFDPTKPVRQRDGAEARILATDCRSGFPIVAEILAPNGKWVVQLFQRDGSALCSTEESLVNIPERSSVWVTARLPSDVKRGVRWTPFTKQEAMAFSPTHAAIELIFDGDEFIEAKYHRS